MVNAGQGPMRPLLSPDVPVSDLGAQRSLHALRPLARLLAERRPAAVISALTYNNFNALMANRLAGRPSRVVISERAQVSGVLTDYTAARRALTLALIRRLYPKADAITAVSRGTAEDLAALSGLAPGTIHDIPNAAPEPEVYSAARRAPCPHPWLQDGAGPVAVAVGRLEAQKNHALMLDALARVRDHGLPLRLLLLGEGRLRARLEDQARTLGLAQAVTFAGFVPNPLDYVVRAELFLMTSWWEGCPNALIEAVAAGVPAISTDCGGGGAREIRGNIRLCPPGDLEALSQAMLERFETPKGASPPAAQPLRIEEVARQYLHLSLGR